MSVMFTVRIVAHPFTKEATQKLIAIDFSEYDLKGEIANLHNGDYQLIETVPYREEGYKIIQRLADELGDEGRAYVSAICDYDIPFCHVYYYLGDGVKAVTFDCDNEDPDRVYSSNGLIGGMLKLSVDEIKALYKEVIEEKPPRYMNRIDLIQELADTLDDWYSFNKEEMLETKTGPLASALFKEIADTAQRCNFQSYDFTPNLGWANIGIAQFSPKEEAYLNRK